MQATTEFTMVLHGQYTYEPYRANVVLESGNEMIMELISLHADKLIYRATLRDLI